MNAVDGPLVEQEEENLPRGKVYKGFVLEDKGVVAKVTLFHICKLSIIYSWYCYCSSKTMWILIKKLHSRKES
jgi:hypothetical protein